MKKRIQKAIDSGAFSKELEFQTSRSRGPGGQHVNKVETKVTLLFNIPNSEVLNDAEKQTILSKHKSKINAEGWLQITAQDTRSQQRNKEIAIQKFHRLLLKSFVEKKVRKPSKPKKSAIEKRLKEKKNQSEKKANRGWRPD